MAACFAGQNVTRRNLITLKCLDAQLLAHFGHHAHQQGRLQSGRCSQDQGLLKL